MLQTFLSNVNGLTAQLTISVFNKFFLCVAMNEVEAQCISFGSLKDCIFLEVSTHVEKSMFT